MPKATTGKYKTKEDLRKDVLHLHALDMSRSKIATLCGVSRRTVSRIIDSAKQAQQQAEPAAQGPVDWSEPLELTDGTPVQMQVGAEIPCHFGGTNPDEDGDYWVQVGQRGRSTCVSKDGDAGGGRLVVNRPSAFIDPDDAPELTPDWFERAQRSEGNADQADIPADCGLAGCQECTGPAPTWGQFIKYKVLPFAVLAGAAILLALCTDTASKLTNSLHATSMENSQ